eukprot:3418110-Prymnesium_polylepis.1
MASIDFVVVCAPALPAALPSGRCGCESGSAWNEFQRKCVDCPASMSSLPGATECSCAPGFFAPSSVQ